MSADPVYFNPDECRRVIIQGPTGERFEAEVPLTMRLSELAAEFAAEQGWPLADRQGRSLRAVVELVNPEDPDDTKRLNGEMDVRKAQLEDGDLLRVLPESIAGSVDAHARMSALVADHNDLQALTRQNPRISFEANRSHAPDRYEVTLRYPSFAAPRAGECEPGRLEVHRVEIAQGAYYPRQAPRVRWLTPIFHPNIAPDGRVCLGVLGERYLPGLGLGRLVRMLAEMVQWRNFDAEHPFNAAAADWAADPANRPLVEAIGGHPDQRALAPVLAARQGAAAPRVRFRPQA